MAKKRKRKMKAGRGKAKGSGYEREICKRLSLWVTHGQSEDVFWRSAISGGRATAIAKRSGKRLERQAGDICATGPEGHTLLDRFYVEIKFYRDLNIEQFLLKDLGKLHRFWAQTRQQARKYFRTPMLIAKQNNTPEILVVKSDAIPDAPILLRHSAYDVILLEKLLAIPYKPV